MPRIKIGDKVYAASALDHISLRDLMAFNAQVADAGVAVKYSDIERISAEIAKMEADPEQNADDHPDVLLMIAVTLWITQRKGGADVTFSDVLDMDVSDFEFIADPEDEAPANPPKRKPRTSPASGLAASAASEQPTA